MHRTHKLRGHAKDLVGRLEEGEIFTITAVKQCRTEARCQRAQAGDVAAVSTATTATIHDSSLARLPTETLTGHRVGSTGTSTSSGMETVLHVAPDGRVETLADGTQASWVYPTGGWIRAACPTTGRALVKVAPLALRLGMQRLSDIWSRMVTNGMARDDRRAQQWGRLLRIVEAPMVSEEVAAARAAAAAAVATGVAVEAATVGSTSTDETRHRDNSPSGLDEASILTVD